MPHASRAGCGSGGGGCSTKTGSPQTQRRPSKRRDVGSVASPTRHPPATALSRRKIVSRACLGDDGRPPALLAEAATDKCEAQANYVRKGRISLQLNCKRAGDNGNVLVMIDGKFTADGFDATSETITQFYGKGDYRLNRKIAGKRVGDCPAGGAKPAA